MKKKGGFIKGLVCSFFFLFSPLTIQAQIKTVGIVVRPYFYGEIEFAHRIVRAGENIGWTSTVIDYLDQTVDQKKFDFTICLVPEACRLSCISYLALFDPIHHYFRSNGRLKSEYLTYDGYLVTYPINFENKFSFFFSCRPWMNWFPLVHFLEYEEVDPHYLFYICCNWGSRLQDEKYKTLLQLLDASSYAHFYGRDSFKKEYPNSYISSIPMDGESLFAKMREDGVCLVLHSEDHLESGIPSGRIFEAIASSAVVISDRNPFVLEHFGDSLLYIDLDASGEELFKQVEEHMHWIRNHKQEAKNKSKKAYEIYKRKFLLEDQLIKLEEMHDKGHS